ncbi:cellulase family glycosylhydrolase [Nibrella viscosa]|uniref:Cellulase family glycosylhydrolase n=1 Tax=Nibrella viscosa TaxID=1084524 RepID=A0ABP8KCY4_9BACT
MNLNVHHTVPSGRPPLGPSTPFTTQWSEDQATFWYAQQPWLTGCNFNPSTAINQIEMWQAETFDPVSIDRELGWAKSLGFNTMRVFLHYLVWQQDPAGLKQRMDQYLTISFKHGIRTMFVFFDDCWNKEPQVGPQPEPVPGVHNSGWVQCPGHKEVTDTSLYPVLEAYLTDIMRSFANDERVIMWDLYNEPGNSGHLNESVPLLTKVFEWAWAVRPSQPLTVGVWNFSPEFDLLNTLSMFYSDVVSFHHYVDVPHLEKIIRMCQGYKRPVICTEYMARTNKNFFETHMPVLKKHNVGAINWGLVSGRSNTIYPWGSPENTPEPAVWFHDIFRADGTPYSEEEVRVIRALTECPVYEIVYKEETGEPMVA